MHAEFRPHARRPAAAFSFLVGGYMHLIPQSWSHLHILVSVFPSVGLIFVLGFYITAILAENAAMKRICLDRKSTRLNSSHRSLSRMPSSA